MASHRSAALLHHFDTFGDRVRRWIELTVPGSRNHRSTSALVHRSADLGPHDVGTVDGVPCTSVARTLLDLGAVVSRDRVEHPVDGALRDGVARRDEQLDMLDDVRRSGRQGVRALAAALTAHGTAAPQSVLERRFLRVLRRHGLPAPVTQERVVRPDGRVSFLDFAYVAVRVAIEVDGHGSHATRAQRAGDAARANHLALAGWTVLRFTYEDVSDRSTEATAAAAVSRALRASRVVARPHRCVRDTRTCRRCYSAAGRTSTSLRPRR